MSELDYEPRVESGRRRKKRRSPSGCLAVVVALAVLFGGFYFVLTKGVELVADRFQSAEDYPGPGTGRVTFEVEEGDTAAEMGRNLKAEGVVASVQAFLDAAAAEPDSAKIQVGFYELQKEMPAADALEVLLDPANQIKSTVTVPEGMRVEDVVELLAEETTWPAGRWEAALEDTEALGLPDYAEGNPEGYLFPATYEIGPKDKPADILSAMVDRWRQAADEAGLEERAAELGKTPAELMVIASLVEAEGRGDDMPKIARVIYNRLDGPGDKGGTNGLLQIDASVNYGLDQELGVALTTEQLQQDTPYNTYTRPGLPPTPIEAPGDAAIEAAANPAEGPWYYYVTVNLATGETKFAETYDEFLQYKDEYAEYCTTSDAC
ncbi:endolytic transglycosylase MltG [Nocardioides gansuensis]|uniref:Endolytic murein transglycosylase n=1 Tax=Nocardioides gansuensis TaxID=2138300 RepID=A0A2T8FAY1_9ACTN|nr:endolytic transglycosylase MltG [Nocardioides gansuensis]PVG82881.1 endolytic transglycosylase MltG [Nocardioides gansuensis]